MAQAAISAPMAPLWMTAGSLPSRFPARDGARRPLAANFLESDVP